MIFLDDLQWADAASLKLIEMFIAVQTDHLFLIGAYRDAEVDAVHPLTFSLDEIQKSGAEVVTVSLDRLNEGHVNQLLSETLTCDAEQSKPLAQLFFEKTLGNPFFLNQFIHSLYRDGLIQFGPEKGNWQWDTAKIRQADMTDNVVNLMISRIHGLSENVAHLLSLAACIGNRFDLNILSTVYGKTVQETANDLLEALQEELVLPAGEINKYVPESFQSLPFDSASSHSTQVPVYEFLHDRVHQAAYSLIEQKERAGVHLKIGQEMLTNVSEYELEKQIFDVVDQLNLGSGLMTDGTEREKFAQLSLAAGKKAKLSAAFEPAFDYLKFGISLLQKNGWEVQYDLTLALYEESAEAAYLCGNFEEMEKLIGVILQDAKRILDKIKAYETRIHAYMSQHKLQDAVKTGLNILSLLGVNFPQKPKKSNILIAYLKTKFALIGKSPDDLLSLPEMTDPYSLAQMRILTAAGLAAYIASSEIVPLAVFKAVNLSIKHGNTQVSAFFFSAYGLVLCGGMEDIESGFNFGRMSLRLLQKFDAKSLESRTKYVFLSCLKHWKKHLRETLQPLEKAFQKGIESGDFEAAAGAAVAYSSHSYFAGIELVCIEKQIAIYNHAIRKIGQGTYALYNMATWQLIHNLGNPKENPIIITGDLCNEKELLDLYQSENNLLGLAGHYTYKLILCYLFESYAHGVENAKIAEKYLTGVISTVVISVFHFYCCLTYLAVSTESPKNKRKEILEKVTKNQRKMKKWAHHAPMNFLHKWQLVEAEKARVLGKDEKAKDLYDQAIAGAKENLYIQEEALANELAAKFYQAKGETETARTYMKQARYCYDHWGAKAKVDHLDQNYPELLTDALNHPLEDDVMEKTSKANPLSTSTSTGPVKSEQLDLASVMKASQVISGEIEIEKLLSRMMRIILENAGAEKGCLILQSGEGFRIEAEGEIHKEEIQVLQSIPAEMRNKCRGPLSSMWREPKKTWCWMTQPQKAISQPMHTSSSINPNPSCAPP